MHINVQVLFSKVAVGKASDGEEQVNHQSQQIFLEFPLTIQQLLIQIRGDIPSALIGVIACALAFTVQY